MSAKAIIGELTRTVVALAAEKVTRDELARARAEIVLLRQQLEQVERQRDDLAAELARAASRALERLNDGRL